MRPEFTEARSDLARGHLIHSCRTGSIRSLSELRKLGKLCENNGTGL